MQRNIIAKIRAKIKDARSALARIKALLSASTLLRHVDRLALTISLILNFCSFTIHRKIHART